MKPNIYMREIMEITNCNVGQSFDIMMMIQGDLSEMTKKQFVNEVKKIAIDYINEPRCIFVSN